MGKGPKGPGSYHDIGKKVKDLLTKDFNYDQKFSLSSTSASGVSFHQNGTKKGEAFTSDVKAEYKHQNVKTEVKIDHKSKVHASVTVDDAAPGVKLTISGTVPDQKSAKAEAHLTQEYFHATAIVGLTAQPILEGSFSVGSQGILVGAEAGYDTATSSATKYNFGLGLTKPDFTAALILADKTDTIKASYLHTLSPTSSVGLEVAHKLSKNDITFTAGASYRVDPFTTTKLRLNNRGSIAAVLQHEFRPKSTFTISGEVDSKALDKSAKVGFALNLKP